MKMKNAAAQALSRKRWGKIPKSQRAEHVPKNGGRKRRYPQCTRGKYHQFVNGACRCGYRRDV